MHKILVVMDITDEHRRKLESISRDVMIDYIPAQVVTASDVRDAEIIVGNINPSFLAYCEKLKLLQLNSAGTDGYTKEGILPDGAVLANATGAYGLAISEHMLASLLCLMKKINMYRLNQERKEWKDEGPVTSIYGSKTLIVGFGDIGNEFGVRMKALGSSITAIRKNIDSKPEYVDALYNMDSLYDCLKEADIVATSLPGTVQTMKVFDKKAFDSMKDGAFFINVGRGTAVDTEALYNALKSGKLAGAALDVTDPEPLPADHKLWEVPNALITPHVSGGYHLMETHNRIIGIAVKNIMHLVNGEEFENLVDMSTGYRKH